MQNVYKTRLYNKLDGRDFFCPAAVSEFMSLSTYTGKKAWIDDIQKCGCRVYCFGYSYTKDISERRRKSFKLLKACQLRADIKRAVNPDLIKYLKIQEALYEAKGISERQILQGMCNRLEKKIIFGYVDGVVNLTYPELRIFVRAIVLFGDKNFYYSYDDFKVVQMLLQDV